MTCQDCPPEPERGGEMRPVSPSILAKIAEHSKICASCNSRRGTRIPVVGITVYTCEACGCPTATRILTDCPRGFFRWN